jgi:membrane protein required for colicin V production
MADFTWVDYAIGTIVILSTLWGLVRGFIREVISLIALFCAIVLAVKCAPIVGASFGWLSSDNLRYLFAFGLIFILVLVSGFFVGKLVHKLIEVVGLGLMDRVLGAGFGAIRGLLFTTVFLFIVGGTAMRTAEWYQQSQILPLFTGMLKWMDDSFPNHLKTATGVVSKSMSHPAVHHVQRLVARHLGGTKKIKEN